ncbi:hypothetical protein JCM10207_007877 [Rhodosporidiobolus poonsookiae]
MPPPTSTRVRVSSGVSALCNCLTAGGVFTFPLWALPLVHALHLSASQLNLIASAAILGEYVTAAYWGSLADRRGPGAVSFAAAVLFAVGFGMLGWRYQVGVAKRERGEPIWEQEWMAMAAFNFLVGCGTAASYFGAIISATKSSPSRHSGLAIGVPCAVFGLSPLFLSSLASAFTYPSSAVAKAGELDAGRYLLFLAAFLALVNGAGALLIKELPWDENLEKVIVEALEPESLEAAGESDFITSNNGSFIEPTERTTLLPRPSTAAPQSPQTLRDLVTTTSFWLLGGVIFFSTGPAEMYMSSLGSILESLVKPSFPLAFTVLTASNGLTVRKRHIAALSISNTLSRLVVGAASDWLAAPSSSASAEPGQTGKVAAWKKNVRLFFLGGACLALVLAYGWGGVGLDSPAGLWVVTLATGVSYGLVFTIVPALVRARWPVESFGRNWGLLTWFSAAGALLFTPLFGVLRDLAADRTDGTCFGPRCYRPIFTLSAASAVLALVMLGVLGRRWTTEPAGTLTRSVAVFATAQQEVEGAK